LKRTPKNTLGFNMLVPNGAYIDEDITLSIEAFAYNY
jgi:hypothetical protein